KVEIFNILGERIVELTEEEADVGFHQEQWTAQVASGLYFYRLEAVSVTDPTRRFVDTKRMILLK
ncbi:MAG TPA: hypothetical protein VJ044_15915, partial [Candidatus Hodarchaeales archaeon]|nr:hypothetical protein [Candidatus Hodarchaeales archaeon]